MSKDLSATSYVVLGLLASLGPSTPYELKRALGESVGVLWPFPHSQLYAEPERLAAAGLVEERREKGGRRRRTYSITQRGRRELLRWLRGKGTPAPELRDPGLLKLFFADLTGEADVVKLAREQEELHQDRATRYEQMERSLGDGKDSRYRAATLRMGLILERASVRFWRAVAEEAERD